MLAVTMTAMASHSTHRRALVEDDEADEGGQPLSRRRPYSGTIQLRHRPLGDHARTTSGQGRAAPTAVMASPRGDQPITILFTDVQGSIQLRARHGDRVADEMLHDHEGIVRRAIGANGGEEAAFLGDGFMATFATPTDGLSCAVAIQQALKQYGRDNPDRRIRVRIGLHHGAAIERDGTLYGQAVNAASRVMAEAAGGQILVTAAVRDSVKATGGFSFVDRGLYWLRGFPDRWRLYEAEWGRDAAGGADRAGPGPVHRARPGAGRPAPGVRGRPGRARLVRAGLG